jgi:hypothetical protein
MAKTEGTLRGGDGRISVPRDLEPARLAEICAKSWRPAWSIRRRVGALAPIIAWLKEKLSR